MDKTCGFHIFKLNCENFTAKANTNVQCTTKIAVNSKNFTMNKALLQNFSPIWYII